MSLKFVVFCIISSAARKLLLSFVLFVCTHGDWRWSTHSSGKVIIFLLFWSLFAIRSDCLLWFVMCKELSFRFVVKMDCLMHLEWLGLLVNLHFEALLQWSVSILNCVSRVCGYIKLDHYCVVRPNMCDRNIWERIKFFYKINFFVLKVLVVIWFSHLKQTSSRQ